jgi:hypothetical protein
MPLYNLSNFEERRVGRRYQGLRVHNTDGRAEILGQ